MTDLYTIGLDYGSLSCRGVLARVTDGAVLAEASLAYPHAIMDRALPDGTPLHGEWALQHPGDYVTALEHVVPALIEHIDPAQVIGVGVDFTASTVIPVDDALRPLSEIFPSRPHAWCKLWKHHGAAAQAARLTEIARTQQRPYLDWYGGKISPECLTSKVAQVFEEDRGIYDAAAAFMEAGDWVTSLLCGKPVFGAAMASAKALWSRDAGYPDEAFFGAFHPDFADMPARKLAARFDFTPVAPGERIGSLCPQMAQRLGLQPGIAVAAPQMDAYTPVMGVGMTRPGQMLMVVGTSTGIMLLADRCRPVPGVTACLPDTYYPGLWGYGSGQASVGDGFQWFADNCVPAEYLRAAQDAGISVQAYLTRLAKPLAPGETGLIALDWFNGNRSPIGNSRLSGMILGLTLQTRPEHMYRALIEATAFGARAVLDAYRDSGVPVEEIILCGGIPGKNPMMMQIYADVLDMPLRVSRCPQAPALGSAILAASAAGMGLYAAVEAMHARDFLTYTPDPVRAETYAALYREYAALSAYFSRGTLMEKLREAAF
ncbi:MAG: ribulokinase [Clostridia bacterium]|nr:ribulokinase [Clostridia bacterium]